ncbi:MAG: thioredoxin domain-containing protein [Candidatus Rokubacteria bacterium]|nr:thioredoxin domain-containing protein [Candidatus Rokubacteria bacterium]
MLDKVLADYAGKVRLVYKDFPLPGHALARPAHEAARCAGAFNKYWEYHDRLFQAQPEFSRSRLLGYATDLGIPAEPFARCLDGGQTRALVEADVEQGRRLGITGTPTFLIDGIRLEGAAPYEAFKQVIDMVLPEGERR